jgi:hypothetical protein
MFKKVVWYHQSLHPLVFPSTVKMTRSRKPSPPPQLVRCVFRHLQLISSQFLVAHSRMIRVCQSRVSGSPLDCSESACCFSSDLEDPSAAHWPDCLLDAAESLRQRPALRAGLLIKHPSSLKSDASSSCNSFFWEGGFKELYQYVKQHRFWTGPLLID